jgi:hypothetical protein
MTLTALTALAEWIESVSFSCDHLPGCRHPWTVSARQNDEQDFLRYKQARGRTFWEAVAKLRSQFPSPAPVPLAQPSLASQTLRELMSGVPRPSATSAILSPEPPAGEGGKNS